MRKKYTEDNFYYGPLSGSSHEPLISGFLNIPAKIYEKNLPQTETEIRIKRANLNDIEAFIGKNHKKINCFYNVKKLCGMEDICLSNVTSSNLISTFIDKIPDCKKKSKIIQSDSNISSGICYIFRKERGEKINKSSFSKDYGINEKHLNKFLLVNSIKSNSLRKKSSRFNNGANIQTKRTEDYFDIERFFVPAIDLDEKNNRIHHKNHIKQEKIIPKSNQNSSEDNPFCGFMACLFFLKFIRECEDTHYEYLLKNKTFYKRGAFFIDFGISEFYNPINISCKFQQYGKTEKFRKIVEQLILQLVEEIVRFSYENDEDINVFKKSPKKNVHILPQNFIQVIKESGFTPPFFV